MIKVQFFSNFRLVTGTREDFFEAKDIKELLKNIVEKYPKLKDEFFSDFKKNKPKDYLVIILNGRSLLKKERFKAKLKDGDTVFIFLPMAGG